MTNPDDAAFVRTHESERLHEFTNGLTKRELFAAMAMQGLLMAKFADSPLGLMPASVQCADALIEELNKKG